MAKRAKAMMMLERLLSAFFANETVVVDVAEAVEEEKIVKVDTQRY